MAQSRVTWRVSVQQRCDLSMNYIIARNHGPHKSTYDCIYPELATGVLAKVGVGVESSLMVATRLSQTKQHHNASCTDAYRCPNWLPEPGTSEYDAAKQTQFIGDVESSTVRFQHLVSRDTEKVFHMNNAHFLTSSRRRNARRQGLNVPEREKNTCVPAR